MSEQIWSLYKFEECLDTWAAAQRESPTDELCDIIKTWFLMLEGAPYPEEAVFIKNDGSIWLSIRVPNSQDGQGHIVNCTYRIDARDCSVHCCDFTTYMDKIKTAG